MMRVYVAQMVSGADVASNLAAVSAHLESAAASQADLVVLPESFALFGADQETLARAEGDFNGPVSQFLCDQAKSLGVWIVAGTLPIFTPAAQKPVARVHVINSEGECHARYDKIHLFDAMVGDSHRRYRESDTYSPGSIVTVCDSPWGKLGISVCYDLRFPELYRKQRDLGADYFIVPSAFTWQTGSAHWEVLCRARAIENACFLIASNQGGQHDPTRRTWGQSMVVNPWGKYDSLREGVDSLVVDLDPSELESIRASLPCHLHRRL